jgi:hypothetical protein
MWCKNRRFIIRVQIEKQNNGAIILSKMLKKAELPQY